MDKAILILKLKREIAQRKLALCVPNFYDKEIQEELNSLKEALVKLSTN
jgi:hypothetical protein